MPGLGPGIHDKNADSRTAKSWMWGGGRGVNDSKAVTVCAELRGQSRSELHFEAIEAADMAVDGIDDSAVVDEHVVDLAGAGRRARHLRHEIGDLLRLVRVRQVVG